MAHHWIGAFLGTALYRYFTQTDPDEPPKRRNGAIIFRLQRFQRRLFAFNLTGGVALLMTGAILVQESIVAWVGVFILAGSVASRNRAIEISDSSISKVWLFGLFKKKIEWSDITHAIDFPSTQTIELYTHQHLRIKHTRYHAGRSQFLKELRKHTKLLSSAWKRL